MKSLWKNFATLALALSTGVSLESHSFGQAIGSPVDSGGGTGGGSKGPGAAVPGAAASGASGGDRSTAPKPGSPTATGGGAGGGTPGARPSASGAGADATLPTGTLRVAPTPGTSVTTGQTNSAPGLPVTPGQSGTTTTGGTASGGASASSGLSTVPATGGAYTSGPATRSSADPLALQPALAPPSLPVPSVVRQPATAGQPQDILPAANAQPANVQAPAQQQNAPAQLFRAKQILGSKVQLSGNVAAGTVDDFVVDGNGYVEYVIVNNSGQFVTVPWDATAFNFEKQTAVINIAPAVFQKIPTYTADRYPVFSEPQYRTTIYRAYGLTPRDRAGILLRNPLP